MALGEGRRRRGVGVEGVGVEEVGELFSREEVRKGEGGGISSRESINPSSISSRRR